MIHTNESYAMRYVYYTVITLEFSDFFTRMTFADRDARFSIYYSSDHELRIGLWSIVVDEVSII